MSRKTELVKNTAILTFGRICTQGISFLLLPLYTAVLSTEDYGTFDLLITYGTLLFPLVGMQMDQGLFRYLLDVRKNHEKQKVLFSTVISAEILQILVFSVLFGTVASVFHVKNWLFLLLYVCVSIISALFLQIARGLSYTKVYAMASFISASMTVVLNVVFLTVFSIGLKGLFISTILATILSIFYLMVKIKPWTRYSISAFDKKVLKEVRGYSLPLIPNNLAWWVVNASDRTIVSYALGVAINGIYTVANKFSNVFITFYNVFNLSWTESVSLHFEDEDRDAFLSETITDMYKLFSAACLCVVAIMPFIFPYMVNTKYGESYNQIIILMYAMLCRVVVGLYSCVYIALKETKKIAYTSAAAAVINVLVNIAFIWKIGLYAASLSTLVAFGVMAVVRYIDVNKYVKMRINSATFVSSIIIAGALTITYYTNKLIINGIALAVIIVYSVLVNRGFIIQTIDTCKKYAYPLLNKKGK